MMSVNAYLKMKRIHPKLVTRWRVWLVAELRARHKVPGSTFTVASAMVWDVAELVRAHRRIDRRMTCPRLTVVLDALEDDMEAEQ